MKIQKAIISKFEKKFVDDVWTFINILEDQLRDLESSQSAHDDFSCPDDHPILLSHCDVRLDYSAIHFRLSELYSLLNVLYNKIC